MTAPAGVRLVRDPAELRAFYADAVPAHIYALVDLEEPFWSASRWYRREDAVVGLVELPDGEGSAVYGVSTKDPEGCLGLLADLVADLPEGLLITGPTGLGDALRPHRALAWAGAYVRYHLADRGRLPPVDLRVEPLDHGDAAELQAFYASDPGAAFFRPHMLADGGFVGVREGGELVAAAGTHVASDLVGCAAIGAVYTRPTHRGRGLGRAVTAGVVHRVSGRIETIGLNVAADNSAARAVYEAIGFRPVLDYDECALA